jgi:two-component system, LytTR family, response regulator
MYFSSQPALNNYMPVNILVLNTSRGTEVIDCSTIIRVEAISNYCKLFFANGKTLVVAKVLAWFEEQLAGKGFLRLHRSHLVNLRFVLRWDKENKAAIILKNYYSLPVSRRKKRHCRQTILQFYNGQASIAA